MIKAKREDDGQSTHGQQAKVQIPVALPGILKDYAKAVLKEQPEDVVKWSAKYFENASQRSRKSGAQRHQNDPESAIQGRLRDLRRDNKGDLIDLTGCKVLNSDFSGSARIPVDALANSWLSRGYSSTQLRELLSLGRMLESSVDRDCFFATVCGTLGSTLRETLILFLEVTSSVDDAQLRMIPYAKFEKVCTFLMQLNSDDQTDASLGEILDQCLQLGNQQGGMVTSQNVKAIQVKAMDE